MLQESSHYLAHVSKTVAVARPSQGSELEELKVSLTFLAGLRGLGFGL